MLSILELRVREIQKLAETRYRHAWGKALEALENINEIYAQLRPTEELIQVHDKEVSRFFNTEFQVDIPLSEENPPQIIQEVPIGKPL